MLRLRTEEQKKIKQMEKELLRLCEEKEVLKKEVSAYFGKTTAGSRRKSRVIPEKQEK